MPKINVYLADDLAEAVKDAAVPVSAVCQRALEQAVRRVTAIREITAGRGQANMLPDLPVVSFTKRAMSALESAQASARAEGLAEFGTGQLLRALLVHGRMAVEVLTALEITPHQIRAALDKRGPAGTEPGDAGTKAGDAGLEPSGAGTEPVMSSQLAAVIELAANESSGLGNGYVGSEHLLLGLIGEPDGVAGSVLRSLGADPRVTRRTVAAALAGWGAHAQRAAENSVAAAQAADQMSAAIRAELEPVLARLDRLERGAAS
jgi:ATP-dependent Clp protease ATP-binding subunit ClpA